MFTEIRKCLTERSFMVSLAILTAKVVPAPNVCPCIAAFVQNWIPFLPRLLELPHHIMAIRISEVEE